MDSLSFVNFAALADLNHEHCQLFFFDAAKDAIVSDAVTPESGKFKL